jgi:hypothetical protein
MAFKKKAGLRPLNIEHDSNFRLKQKDEVEPLKRRSGDIRYKFPLKIDERTTIYIDREEDLPRKMEQYRLLDNKIIEDCKEFFRKRKEASEKYRQHYQKYHKKNKEVAEDVPEECKKELGDVSEDEVIIKEDINKPLESEEDEDL